MATKQAFLIEYEYCSGCSSCVLACQLEHDLPAEKKGITLTQVGPDQLGERTWQFDNIPVITDRCDRCADRQGKGKRPLCEQSCQSGCIKIDTLENLVEYAKGTSAKYVIYG